MSQTSSRRAFLKMGTAATASLVTQACVGPGRQREARASGAPELILRNGRFTTMDERSPQAQAVAIADGRFTEVGAEAGVMQLRGADTKVIDLKGRTVIPGLTDTHLHVIRGGLN